MGVAAVQGTIPWKGARLGCRRNLENPIWSKVFRKRRLRELPPSTSTLLSLTSFTMGQTIRGYCPYIGIKSGWSPRSKVMGTSDHLKSSGGGESDRQDLPGCEFLLSLGLIRVGATKKIVDLLACLGEVALGILRLLLTIGRFGHLENLIYKTVESVIVSGLVLSLGVKNTNAIQEAFEFTQPRPVLLMVMRPTMLTEWSGFLFLAWPFDEQG
jgi:hypothetical protein